MAHQLASRTRSHSTQFVTRDSRRSLRVDSTLKIAFASIVLPLFPAFRYLPTACQVRIDLIWRLTIVCTDSHPSRRLPRFYDNPTTPIGPPCRQAKQRAPIVSKITRTHCRLGEPFHHTKIVGGKAEDVTRGSSYNAILGLIGSHKHGYTCVHMHIGDGRISAYTHHGSPRIQDERTQFPYLHE